MVVGSSCRIRHWAVGGSQRARACNCSSINLGGDIGDVVAGGRGSCCDIPLKLMLRVPGLMRRCREVLELQRRKEDRSTCELRRGLPNARLRERPRLGRCLVVVSI